MHYNYNSEYKHGEKCLKLPVCFAIHLFLYRYPLNKRNAEHERLPCVSVPQSPVDVVTGGVSPVRDTDRLLQDMDINRLRAVVFRDIVSAPTALRRVNTCVRTAP